MLVHWCSLPLFVCPHARHCSALSPPAPPAPHMKCLSLFHLIGAPGLPLAWCGILISSISSWGVNQSPQYFAEIVFNWDFIIVFESFSVYMSIKSKTSRNFLKASPLIASQLVALETSQEWLSLQAFLRDLCLVLLSHSCFKLLSSFLSGNSSNGETQVSKGIFYWRDFPTKKTLAKKNNCCNTCYRAMIRLFSGCLFMQKLLLAFV